MCSIQKRQNKDKIKAEAEAEESSKKLVKNQSQIMEYDFIAVAASMKLDYFDHSRSRLEIMAEIQHYHEIVMNRTVAHLPMICPSKSRIQALYNASVSIEQSLFPERANNHDLLEESFAKVLKERQLCHVDTETLFGIPEWDAFFRTLFTGEKGTQHDAAKSD